LGEGELTSSEISLKIKEAADPKGVFRKTQTYLIRQKINVSGGDKPGVFYSEIKYKSPDKIRSDYFYEGKIMSSIIVNGERAWSLSGTDSSASEISGNQLDRLKLFTEMAVPVSTFSDIFDKIEIETITENGKTFYLLQCRPKSTDLPLMSFYIDKSDFLERKMLTSNEKGEPYSAEINKYSVLENVMIPSETTVHSGGITQKIILEEFKLNVEINDSVFIVEKK
jgi:outer membrane lipoprotein-sorting protein